MPVSQHRRIGKSQSNAKTRLSRDRKQDMDTQFILNFVNILATALQILILGRVLMSWVSPNPTSAIGRFLVEVTDPIMKPFQKILPPMAGIDFSPILALVTIQVLQTLIANSLG